MTEGDVSRAENNDYANPLVCAVFVALCPIWVLIARKIPSTREVLYSGWEPVIIAMAISRYRLSTFLLLEDNTANISQSQSVWYRFFTLFFCLPSSEYHFTAISI